MQDKKTIAFTTTVTERDWDTELSGWRCPALKIPGAIIDSVFVSGNRIDRSWYEVNFELNIIRWLHSERPPQATVLIKLTEELSTKELTLRWKKLAIILPLITTVIVAVISAIIPHHPSISTQPPTNSNTTTTPSTPSACDEGVRITTPANLENVNMVTVIQGTHQNIMPGQQLWIVVYPSEVGRYYPQGPVTERSKNTWYSQTYVGLQHDTGRTFHIIAVVADKQAQDVLNDYIKRAKDEKNSSGMVFLPDSARVCQDITVTRK